LSVFVALSLTPALCATLLKPASGDHYEKKGFFGWFNRYFDKGRDKYQTGVGHVIGRAGRWVIIYPAVVCAVVLMFMRLQTSFLPDEDQGLIYVQVQTPPGATQARTGAALDDVSNYLLHDESAIVDATFVVNGNNAFGRGQNQGQIFVRLKDWSERTAPGSSA